MDWHRSHLPIDELHIMAEAIRRFVDSDGDRHPIGISTNCAKRSIAGKPTRISN
jgi:acyl dehydratase